MYLHTRIHTEGMLKKKKKKKKKEMLMQCFSVLFFPDFLYTSICCGYSFEWHQQVDALYIGIHNICFHKEVEKIY